MNVVVVGKFGECERWGRWLFRAWIVPLVFVYRDHLAGRRERNLSGWIRSLRRQIRKHSFWRFVCV